MENDKLDCLIALSFLEGADEELAFFDSLDTSEVVWGKSFCKKRNSIIRKYRYQPIVRKIRTAGARVAVVALALIVASVVAVTAIPPLRDSVFKAIVNWYEDYLTISYDIPNQNSSLQPSAPQNSESDENGLKVPKSKIEEIRKPSYLPDGVVENMVCENDVYVIIDYYSDDKLVYSFNQSVLNKAPLYISNNSAVVNDITINGYPGKMIINDEVIHLVWNDGEYEYLITSEFENTDYLLTIAESVK